MSSGSATGGIGFNPRKGKPKIPRPKPGLGGLVSPPALTFDPAIEAQRRAAQRGLADTTADTGTERHFGHTDLATALRSIKVKSGRQQQDIGLQSAENQRKLDYQEADVRQQASRAQSDYQTQLAGIARKFGELGHTQGEAANAAGVNDAGTQAAGQAARQRNQTISEEPIHTAQQRTGEDLATELGRIGSARSELSGNVERALHRLAQDTGLQQRLAGRETSRKTFELKRKLQRAIREGAISNADLLAQEIWQARESHPAALAQWGQANPGAMLAANQGGAPRNQRRRRNH